MSRVGEAGERTAPERVLSLADAFAVVVGAIVGVGIFFTPSHVARLLPSTGAALAAWAAGGAIAALGALTYAELAAALPRSGGQFVFLREAFGPLPAFLFGWLYFAVVSPGALAIVAAIAATHLGLLVGGLPPAGTTALALLVVLAFSATNALGVRPGARVQKATVVLKLAGLAAVVFVGLFLAPERAPDPPLERAPDVTLFGGALVFVLFSYGGWQVVTFVGGEVRDPARNLPRATLLGVAVVCCVYLLANWSYLRLLPPERLAGSATPAAAAVGVALGGAGEKLVAAAIAVSALGIANSLCLGNTRVTFAMAREGFFFRSLGRLSPTRGTPVRAIAAQAVLAFALLLSTGAELPRLLNGVTFPDWLAFAGTGAAAIALRKRRPDLPRPYRTPLFPVVPALFVAAALYAAGSAFYAYPGETGAVLAVAAVGTAGFLLSGARRRRFTA